MQERMADWSSKFGETLGLKILEVTGDTDFEEQTSIDALMDAADIICTTPEKFGITLLQLVLYIPSSKKSSTCIRHKLEDGFMSWMASPLQNSSSFVLSLFTVFIPDNLLKSKLHADSMTRRGHRRFFSEVRKHEQIQFKASWA